MTTSAALEASILLGKWETHDSMILTHEAMKIYGETKRVAEDGVRHLGREGSACFALLCIAQDVKQKLAEGLLDVMGLPFSLIQSHLQQNIQ